MATLAGGCFWCLEAVYLRVRGVTDVISGYSNGHDPNPSYESVCTGRTGHAEVVRIHFDPDVVSYRELLEVFFRVHDPTTLNRQGNDTGTQYRSGIYTHSDEQASEARACVAALTSAGAYERPIVTQVEPVSNYHPAEAEHHRYFERHPFAGYCAFVVAPKVSAFREAFGHMAQEPEPD